MPQTEGSPQQSLRFLLLYGLAAAGGAVAYVPFLTILLPVRVSAFAGEQDVTVLAYSAFAGAIAASLANIGFGWISDRVGARRPLVLVGLILSSALLITMRFVDDLRTLLLLIVSWQCALNMMLAPLAAWAGDCVPDRQKGLLGGLMSFSPALGALSGALVTMPGLADADTRLVIIAALVASMILPVIVFGRPRPMPHLMHGEPEPLPGGDRPRHAVARMWLARLLVQIAEAALFAYLLFWLRGIETEFGDNDTATLFAIVLAISVPLALGTGRWSDARNKPLVPLFLGAGVGALGLIAMGFANDIATAIAGYVVFGLATSVFLALHSAQTLRVLPRPATRGRDLGVFNLTNTVPSLIMPWLTLALVPVFGFGALFLLLAALAAAAAVLLWSIAKI